eukprot:TRINITY_DN17137_c1_g2_i1.p1 TRINITY_DN17137_c1_g2~~TRINITY_DN17137_c1_g2_i1.p1  ORF type:complete len:576 (+),score=311.13 TRINITY_DN17137_c1_g2_i1:98-1729(+)
MQNEILRLYEQKEGRDAEPMVKEFIEGLTVKEVARIWSLMGGGEDFIEALKRLLTIKIEKVSGGNIKKDANLDDLVALLKDEKEKKLREEEETKQKAVQAEKERKELEIRMKEEEEASKKARIEHEEAERKQGEERKAVEEAAQAKIEADKKAAQAAEDERLAAEKAAQAAEADRVAAQEACEKARRDLADLQKQAEEAEEARRLAEESAAKEEAELERKQALRLAAEEREAEQRREAERLEKEREAAEEKAREMEEERQKEEEERKKEEEEIKDESITIILETHDEPLGLDCLAGAGRVRIIDVSGACDRAGVKPASVLLKVDGREVNSQESLIEAVQALRATKKTEFEVVVQPPLLVSDEDKEILRKFNEQKEEIRKWKEMVDECQNVRVEMKVLQGINLLDKGSTKPFCEVKLRECHEENGQWKVGSNHKNPQKGTTKTVTCQSNKKHLTPAVWDEIFTFESPKQDCIRVSVFGHRTLMKEYLGRVDLLMPELLEELCIGPILARWPIQGQDEGRGPVGGDLELALNLVACDGREDPDGE